MRQFALQLAVLGDGMGMCAEIVSKTKEFGDFLVASVTHVDVMRMLGGHFLGEVVSSGCPRYDCIEALASAFISEFAHAGIEVLNWHP